MAWTQLLEPWPRHSRSELDRLRRELDHAFEGYGSLAAGNRGMPYPPVNVYETEDAYVVTAELPGVDREALDVSVEGQRLSLRGERKVEHPQDEKASLHRRERQAGIFRRTLELPGEVDAEKTEAVYRNGVLTVKIHKAEQSRPRRISVQAS
jgi:HSP20 family protein